MPKKTKKLSPALRAANTKIAHQSHIIRTLIDDKARLRDRVQELRTQHIEAVRERELLQEL